MRIYVPFSFFKKIIGAAAWRFFTKLVGGLFLIFLYVNYAFADVYSYRGATGSFSSAMAACVNIGLNSGWQRFPLSNHSVSLARSGNGSIYYKCFFDLTDTITTGGVPQVSNLGPYNVIREGDSCDMGKAFNSSGGECIENCSLISETLNRSTQTCGHDEQKGIPAPDSCVGNPINIAVGNKYQNETDYRSFVGGGVEFARSYNSLDRTWRHSYSPFIRFSSQSLALVHADGRESFFQLVGSVAVSSSIEKGVLTKVGQAWVYVNASNEVFSFDNSGRLAIWERPGFSKQEINYFNSHVVVSINGKEAFRFIEDARHQPLSFTAPNLQIDYIYGGRNELVSLSRTLGGRVDQRKFYYEDPRHDGLLTGIDDERGIRFATWSYDEQGRAISSSHSNGVGLTQIVYSPDGSSTVVNELGKSTTYHYQTIDGVKRVSAIKGEPSANCPASNSSYSYDEHGLMLAKTDAKGLITTYAYNDRGLEVSRTEASGTTLARTVTTEWDSDHFLPIKIVDPERITEYTYDSQGRELSRRSIPR